MTKEKNIVVLFDGVCNLCNGFVHFIIKRDTKARIKFAALQSNISKIILQKKAIKDDEMNSVIVLINDEIYTKSTAAILLLVELGGFWKCVYLFYFIPKFIRDFFYNIIAKNRYKVFGKKNSCLIPSKELAVRFIQ